jgi:murein DD-endopeptidase MepM/ murein hydrolase activator NlpD
MPRRLFFHLLLIATFLITNTTVLAQQPAGPVYIVQPGDTLSSIAARFNISLNDLMSANNISDPNLLSPGQELLIPGLEGINGILDTETINLGDSLRSLLRRKQISAELVERLNHLISPTEMYVGASVIVPRQENALPLKAIPSPAKGESLLEVAISQDTTPWGLVTLNGLAGTWAGLPGEALYAPGGDSGQRVSGLPFPLLSAQLKGLPLKQGGTAVIFVQAAPGATLGGMLVDHPLHFFPWQNETQVALQGVHALLEPGLYPLRLEATLPDGSQQSFEQMVLVVSGNYPEDPVLYVDPSTIDPAVTEPENQQILSVVSAITSEKLWKGEFMTPASTYADSTYFTSKFGNRRTYIGQGTDLKITGFHTGLDFGGGTGLSITAPAAGRVVFTGELTVRGKATIIDHGWGVFSGFWHQSEFKVNVGDMVEQGQVIGLVGGTGRVTGAHLHWELWVNGVQVDPLDWLTQEYP